MDRLRFGAFLAPHHPTGEHPTLLFQRDLDLVAHLDRLAGDVPRRRRSSEPHDPPRHRRDQPARPPPVQSATARTRRLQALPTQWAFAEEAAATRGSVVDRRDWRVLMAWHLAETRDLARAEAVHGLHRWHNEYNVSTLGRPRAVHVEGLWDLLERTTAGGAEGAGAAVVGTPDDLVAAIRRLRELTGGFGVVLGFAHDWADREATLRSWDLSPATSCPRSTATRPRCGRRSLHDHQAELMGAAGRAVMAKIMAHDGAARALATTVEQRRAADAAFRPGAGIPERSPGDDGEGDGGGVADVQRVDTGVDGDAHLPGGSGAGGG